MKTFNKIIVLITFAVLFSCKKDDGNNQFLLSYENLAGTYDLVYLNGYVESTVIVQGIPVTAITTIEGDTFQVEAIFNQNGNYSIDGEYRTVTSVTVAGQTETDNEIIVVDETGTYQIDANAQTITFTTSQGSFTGTFDVTMFNQYEVHLVQEEHISNDGVTSDSTFEIHFERQ